MRTTLLATISLAASLGLAYAGAPEGKTVYVAKCQGCHGANGEGKAAIAYGVFGVPETFFIDGSGRIVDKYVGPMTRSTIAALVARAKEGAR